MHESKVFFVIFHIEVSLWMIGDTKDQLMRLSKLKEIDRGYSITMSNM